MWFAKPKPSPALVIEHKPLKKPLRYPKWTFARVEGTDDYYLILEQSKMKFISQRAFHSWGKNYVVVSEESISGYPSSKRVGFAPGTILISTADKTEWYITGSDMFAMDRRRIATPDFYDVLGFDIDDAYVVSLNEIDFHKKGEDIVGISL